MTAPERAIWFSKDAPVVMVAGGAQFLGSHLCESLVAQHLNILCIDAAVVSRKSAVEHLSNRGNFVYLHHDITHPFPENIPLPQFIFHLVGVDEILAGEELSRHTLLVNALGTHRLLELAVRAKARFCLASSIYVYEGAISSLSLSHYAGPRPEDLDTFTHHEAKRFAEALVAHVFAEEDLDARVVRLPEVYGPGMDLSGKAPLNKLIAQTVRQGELRLEGDGTQELLLLEADDAVAGLTAALFDRDTKGGIYHLVPEKPISVREVAEALKKSVYPSPLSIRHVPPLGAPSAPVRHYPPPALSWNPTVSLAEGLARTLTSFNVRVALHLSDPVPSKPRPTPAAAPAHTTEPSRLRRWHVVVVLGGLFVTLLTPVAILLLSLLLGKYAMAQTLEHMRMGSAESVAVAQAATAHFDRAAGIGQHLSAALAFVGVPEGGDELRESLRAAEAMALGLSHLARAQQALAEGLAELDAPAASETTERYVTAQVDAEIADHTLAAAEATLQENRGKPSAVSWVLGPREILSHIRSLREQATRMRQATQVLPQLLSLRGQKEYLVLLVDNEILRPGGGAIVALGVVRVEKGHVTEVAFSKLSEFADVASVAKAPESYRNLFGETLLPIGDWLWWADTPTSGRAALTLFEQATGRRVDGVILIDGTALNGLSEIAGTGSPVVQAGGDATRREIQQGEAFQRVFKKLIAGEISWALVGEKLVHFIEGKHVIIYSADPGLETKLADLGWNGAFPASQTNLLAHAYTETTLDARPASEISRDIQRSIQVFEDLSVEERIIVSLRNTKSTAAQRSIFAQLWLPREYEIKQLKVDGEVVEGVVQDEVGWKAVGLKLSLTPGQSRIIQLTARRETPLMLSGRAALTLLSLKQPGIGENTLTTRLVLPTGTTPIDVRPDASVADNGIAWETQLDRDRFFVLNFP